MKKIRGSELIIKNFLLAAFCIMCVTALFVCTEYARNNTRRRIDGSESARITDDEIVLFFYNK